MKPKKILVVDDEKDILESCTFFLQSFGWEVLTAMDGQEALEIALQELPDLIVMDVVMPRMDGFQACQELKKHDRTKKIPILMLTAKAQESDREAGLKAGADDFLVKPYRIADFAEKVRYFLSRPEDE